MKQRSHFRPISSSAHTAPAIFAAHNAVTSFARNQTFTCIRRSVILIQPFIRLSLPSRTRAQPRDTRKLRTARAATKKLDSSGRYFSPGDKGIFRNARFRAARARLPTGLARQYMLLFERSFELPTFPSLFQTSH